MNLTLHTFQIPQSPVVTTPCSQRDRLVMVSNLKCGFSALKVMYSYLFACKLQFSQKRKGLDIFARFRPMEAILFVK